MFKFLVPALAAGFLCLPALAGTVFIQHTFDLGLADTVTPTQLRYSSDEFAALTIHQGDTVELDYSFLPGQAVSMASANGYQLFNLGLYQDASDPLNTSNFSVEGLQMSLYGVAGATLAPLHGFNQSGGTAHLGALFGGPYLPADTFVTFTGIRARFVVGELENGYANYNAAFFSVGAATVGVAEVAVVPEPETYAMFGAGLAMLALVRSGRRRGGRERAIRPLIPRCLTLISAALCVGAATSASAAAAAAEPAMAGPRMTGPLMAAARETAPSLIEQLTAAHGQPQPFALALDTIHPGVAGTRIARLHHTYGGVRIWQSESVVTLADDGAVIGETLTDRRAALATEGGADALPERPPLSAQEAINLVLAGIERGARPLEETTAELVVYPLMARTRNRTGAGKPLAELNAVDVDDVVTDYRLAYVVSTRMLIRDELQFWDHIISAEDGHLIDRHSARNDVAGVGHSQYNGTVGLNTTLTGGKYVMKDTSRGANGKFGGLAVTNADNDYNETGTLYSDADNQWGDGLQYVSGASTTGANGQTAAVNAMFGLMSAYDTMKNVMNWYSLDGNNTATYATVHYGAGHGNAGYTHGCGCIQIGDAGMNGYKNLGAVDVLGHEMGHGVTRHTSKLSMYGEPGALNESGADINGEMAEAYARNGAGGKHVPAGNDWLLGRDIMPQGQPLRYLQKPSKDGKSRDAWSFDIGKLDPHYSSGANNRMFYFLSQGSDAKAGADGHSVYLKRTPKAMTGIGNDKAYRIWFTANTTKFAAATNYATARDRVLDAARQLYGDGSAEAVAVQRAYAAINVGYDIDELGYKSPVALLTQPASTGVTIGRPANFTAYAEAGTAPYFYAWYKNGARVRNVTGPGYSFIATAADAGAKITVRVTDSANLPTTATSQTAVLSINPPGTLYERIANGGFEDSELDWAGHLNNISSWSQYPAYAGKKMAWFGIYESSAGTALYQALTIPANTATATLSFALKVETTGYAATARDHFRVEVRGLFNQPLALVKAFSNLDAAPGFVIHSFDLGAFRGQTVRLRFASSSDGNQDSSFMLDNVSLKTE